jgi:acyl-CoA dehydrogenase
MDFALSAKAQDYHKRLTAFMTEFVFPPPARKSLAKERALAAAVTS